MSTKPISPETDKSHLNAPVNDPKQGFQSEANSFDPFWGGIHLTAWPKPPGGDSPWNRGGSSTI